jgi:hypothetical protein
MMRFYQFVAAAKSRYGSNMISESIAEPPIMEKQPPDKNLLVAVFFFGSLLWPGVIWLLLRYASAGSHTNYSDPLVSLTLRLGGMVEVAMVISTLLVTLVNWRSLKWRWRLIGIAWGAVIVVLIVLFLLLLLSPSSWRNERMDW